MAFEQLLPIIREGLQVPGLLKEIYTDTLKPGCSQVGKALGSILGLGNTILLPIHLLNERARFGIENNLEKYRESLEIVPEADIVSVRPEVGVPILEKLMYVTDDELSDLYVNLLSKASVAETAGLAHPSFVHIINCLSPDEAILLKAVNDIKLLVCVEVRMTRVASLDTAYNILKRLCTGIEQRVKFSFPDNLEAYFRNLDGHGILEIRDDIFLNNPALYQKLEEDLRTEVEQLEWYQKRPADRELSFQRGTIEITSFGQLFLGACLKKVSQS